MIEFREGFLDCGWRYCVAIQIKGRGKGLIRNAVSMNTSRQNKKPSIIKLIKAKLKLKNWAKEEVT